MANLDITYADLESTAVTLDSGRDTITKTLVLMQKAVSALIGAGFRTDKASGAFDDSYTQLNQGITDAVGGLEGMAQFLRATAKAYSDTDTQLAAGIKG